jgi:hypothetical protein
MKQCAKNMANNVKKRMAFTLSKCVFFINRFIKKLRNQRNIAANFTAKEKNFCGLQNNSTFYALYVFSNLLIFSNAKLSQTNISNKNNFFSYG